MTVLERIAIVWLLAGAAVIGVVVIFSLACVTGDWLGRKAVDDIDRRATVVNPRVDRRRHSCERVKR